jgi:hypothetical protein
MQSASKQKLQRIDLYRAMLNRGFSHAIRPEYVAARWSQESEHPRALVEKWSERR